MWLKKECFLPICAKDFSFDNMNHNYKHSMTSNLITIVTNVATIVITAHLQNSSRWRVRATKGAYGYVYFATSNIFICNLNIWACQEVMDAQQMKYVLHILSIILNKKVLTCQKLLWPKEIFYLRFDIFDLLTKFCKTFFQNYSAMQ